MMIVGMITLIFLLIILILRYLLMIRGYDKFSHALSPLLHAVISYLSVLIESIESELSLQHNALLNQHKEKIYTLLAAKKFYPEWVFSSGFNSALAAGYRFFLLKFEMAIELLFALHYLLIEFADSQSFKLLQASTLTVMIQNKALFDMIIDTLMQNNSNTYLYDLSDYNSDTLSLENSVNEQLPMQLSLFSLTSHSENLLIFLQNIKDLRMILLELVASLPQPQ